MKPIALSSIRQQNLRRVLDLLTQSPSMTRNELAEAADLSLMTVTNLIDLLKQQEVLCLTPIQREGKDRPAFGRKAEAISLRGDRKAWLVVDISNQQFTLTLMGFDAQPLMKLHDDGQGEYLQRLERFLCQAKDQVDEALAGRQLLWVAVVTPGPYEIASDTVYNQRLPQLDGVGIKALFQRCLGDHEYYVDEDVKFAVRSFSDLIEQSRCEVLYYLYIGEGVGGAAVHGGNVLRGLNAAAGDAGHLLDQNGDTYESRLSVTAFARLLQLPDDLPPDSLLEAIDQLAQREPERYAAALDEMARITAEMLHGVLWMLDPTHLIIDCCYAYHDQDRFIAAVGDYLSRRYARDNRRLPELVSTPQVVGSVVRGAVRVLQREWMTRLLK